MPGITVDTYIETWDDGCTSRLARSQWLAAYPNLTSLSVESLPTEGSLQLHGITFNPRMLNNTRDPYILKHRLYQLPHLWKMYKCSLAIEAAQVAGSFIYDAVVKARPDSRFWHASNGVVHSLPEMTRRVALNALHGGSPRPSMYHFLGGADARYMVSDKYAAGTQHAMQFYLHTWDEVYTTRREEPDKEFTLGEKFLFQRIRRPDSNVTARPVLTEVKTSSKTRSSLWRPSGFEMVDTCKDYLMIENETWSRVNHLRSSG